MFDIHTSIYSKHGEHDEERAHDYIDGLMEEFAAAPEAQPIIEQYGEVTWAGMMMEHAFGYVGVSIPKMTVRDVNEVLFDLFPRKVSTEPETAFQIIDELEAFWKFIRRQYGLTNASRILDTLTDDAAAKLRDRLADPRCWGMAKSFVMKGIEAGYDMHTEKGINAFMMQYNARVFSQPPAAPEPPPFPNRIITPDFDDDEPAPSARDDGSDRLSPWQRSQERRKQRRKLQRQARKQNRR